MGKLLQIDCDSIIHMCNIMHILLKLEIIYLKNPNVVPHKFIHSFRTYLTFPRDEHSTELSWYLRFSTTRPCEE